MAEPAAKKQKKTDVNAATASREEHERNLGWAEEMVPIIGRIARTKRIQCTLYGTSLVGCAAEDVIKVQKTAWGRCDSSAERPGLEACLTLLKNIDSSDASQIEVDLARGASLVAANPSAPLSSLLPEGACGQGLPKPRDCVLYGFGRIGRLLCRLLTHGAGAPGLVLRAVVLRPGKPGDLEKRASSFQFDSVHGAFSGTVEVDEEQNALVVNGYQIKVIYSPSPDKVDYAAHGIHDAIVVDNTGAALLPAPCLPRPPGPYWPPRQSCRFLSCVCVVVRATGPSLPPSCCSKWLPSSDTGDRSDLDLTPPSSPLWLAHRHLER